MKRRIVIGGVLGLAAAGGAAWKFHLFAKHYAPTPYDDLLNQIVDREPAAKLGAVVLRDHPELDAPSLAKQLRAAPRALAGQAPRDATDDKLMEVAGWVLPQSVALYAALAAKAA
jgi:hypothetical protein